jgi:integrase
MAHYRQRGKTWQATVELKGHDSKSATFRTKQEAVAWATNLEAEIRAGRLGIFPSRTLDDAMRRYELEVSSRKRNADGEFVRMNALRKDYPDLCSKILHKITAADISAWRDSRLRKVTPGSVQRDINLYRHLWNVAAKEWGWCSKETPWSRIRLPGDNPPRDSMWRWQQIRLLLRRLGYVTGRPPSYPHEEIAYMFLLGLHTGMRQGEIKALTKDRINLETRTVRLVSHKTFETVGARTIPIPRRAAKLLKLLVPRADEKTGQLFRVRQTSVDTLFRRYRDQCLIGDFTFHDSRATALTLLARRVDVFTLCRISGHTDASMILKRYYRERAEDIAARI